MQPLAGVKVLDFSTLLPGPVAGLLLAEAGAEVLKIERPATGEDMRHWPPMWGETSVNFAMFNRGKQGLVFDLKQADCIEEIKGLVKQADILIEQFRPGVMQRLGLGYEQLHKINPKLIYCSITGYGQSGPKKQKAGHDLNYVSETGTLAITQPVLPPVAIADLAGGTYPAIVNILLALINVEKTGEGCHLDISMSDNMFFMQSWAYSQTALYGAGPQAGKELLNGGSPRYQLYRTSDGKYLAAAPIEDKFWDEFCRLTGLDQQYRRADCDARVAISEISAIIASHDGEYWHKIFAGADCCCNMVVDQATAMKDEHFRERGLFEHLLENEQGELLPALPVCISPLFRDRPDGKKSAPELPDE